MAWQNAPLVKEGAVLAAAFLLLVPKVLAGDRVHAASRPPITSQSAPSAVVRATPLSRIFFVSVTTLAQPPTEAVFVDVRGPDGQMRRFPVEGGRAAIQYRDGFLRPGDMLTIHWTRAK